MGSRTLRAGPGLTWGEGAGSSSARSQILGRQRSRETSGAVRRTEVCRRQLSTTGQEDSLEGELPVNARGTDSRQKFQTGIEAPPKNSSYPASFPMQPIRGAQPSGAPPPTSLRAGRRPRPPSASVPALSLRRRRVSLAPARGREWLHRRAWRLRRCARPEPPLCPSRPVLGMSTDHQFAVPKPTSLTGLTVYASVKGVGTAFRPRGVASGGDHLRVGLEVPAASGILTGPSSLGSLAPPSHLQCATPGM